MHKRQHHPDYARIAELEREIGIGEPVYQPLPEAVMQEVLRPPAPHRPVVTQRPDQVCAQCIPGRPPAHSCPFWPVCQS